MHKKPYYSLLFAAMVLILASQGCSSAQAPTPTAAPTKTSPPPTATLRPTATLWPTSTPNATATQQYTEFYTQVQDYYTKGYLSSNSGNYFKLEDFSQEWPQINWYQWWLINRYAADFVINAHFKWSTASPTPEDSGCGFIFALQKNDNHYAVFLDKTRIVFLENRVINGQRGGYEVGKTRGTGRVNIVGDPSEADFSLAVNGNLAYITVNNEFVGEYTLSQDSTMLGQLGYTLLSGTNKDYGTRCEMTNVKLWVIK